MSMSQPRQEEIERQMSLAHEDQRGMYRGVSIFLIILSSVCVTGRFYARWHKKLPLGIDDWLTIPALIFSILLCVEVMIAVDFGVGLHMFTGEVDTSTLFRVFQIGFYNSITWATAVFFVKLSILFFYRRVFGMRTVWFKWALYGMMFYVSALWIVSIIVLSTQCRPISFFWQRFNPQNTSTGSCPTNTTPSELGLLSPSIAADFILILLPIVVINQLQLTWEKKAGVTAVFLAGILAGIAGIMRAVSSQDALKNPFDLTWSVGNPYMWVSVEACVGLACACVPIVAPALPGRKVLSYITPKSFMSSRSGGSSKNTGNSSMASASGGSQAGRWRKLNTRNDTNKAFDSHGEMDSVALTAYPVEDRV